MLGDLAVALADEAFNSGPLGGKLSVLLTECRILSNLRYLAVVWRKDAHTLVGAFNLAEPSGTEKWVGAYDRRRSFAGKVLKAGCGTVLKRPGASQAPQTKTTGKAPAKEYDALHAAARYGVTHMIGTVIPMHAEGSRSGAENAPARTQAFGVLLMGYTAAPESHGRLDPTVLDLALFLANHLPDQLPSFAEDLALFSPLLPSYRAMCPCCGGNPHPPHQPDDQNPGRCQDRQRDGGRDDAPHGASALLIPIPTPSLPQLGAGTETKAGAGPVILTASAGTPNPQAASCGERVITRQGSGSSGTQQGFDETTFYGEDPKAAAHATGAAVHAVQQRPRFAMHADQQQFADPRIEAQFRYETAAAAVWRDFTLLLIMVTYLFFVTYIKPFTVSQYPGSVAWFVGFAVSYVAILFYPTWYIKHRDSILAAWLIAIRCHALRTVWLVVNNSPGELPLVAMHCMWCFPVQFAIDSVFIMRDAWLRRTVMPIGIAAAVIAFPQGYGILPPWAATLWSIGHILAAEGISLWLERKSDAQTRAHFVQNHSSRRVA